MGESQSKHSKRSSFPGTWQILAHAMLSGVFTALVCTVVWTISVLVATWIDTPDQLGATLLHAGMLVAIGGCITVVPGAVGGLIIGAVLLVTIRIVSLSLWYGILVGTLIGFGYGVLFLLVTWTLNPEGACDGISCWLVVAMQYLGIPILGGNWHGWHMTRWMQNRSEAEPLQGQPGD